ncbi:polymer-forming cytoskeletal protein [Ideonella sp. 4Y11]|uniref:Polymer-forming cytoskeletal protein n=1 Tax=Ideonella aquatica TaxID=2824119 RepID=A0A940YGG9_9BURK|nr:polymer-forming cytoskeletal protein [Ideonella aquatica]MBQ0957394.1 polymer-forming cytoskeletal protein [Ideonella aquatica]
MDDTTALPSPDDNGQPAAEVPAIALGQTMPDVDRVPTLQPAVQALPSNDLASRHSTLASGLSFTGAARIVGSITVAGEVQGDLRLEQSPDGHVTITETGTVVGDISAPNIAVMGQAVGLLDASGGRVTLHESASVSGRIRYTHLQVNGADLNAQLERVRTDVPKQG